MHFLADEIPSDFDRQLYVGHCLLKLAKSFKKKHLLSKADFLSICLRPYRSYIARLSYLLWGMRSIAVYMIVMNNCSGWDFLKQEIILMTLDLDCRVCFVCAVYTFGNRCVALRDDDI